MRAGAAQPCEAGSRLHVPGALARAAAPAPALWRRRPEMAAIPQFEDVKFEAASLLSELYCQENSVDAAKPLLRKAIQISQQTPYWHCRLLFQLAQLHTLEKDLVSACDLLGVGAEYARVVGSEYTRALFLLSKGMLLLMERKLQEVHPLLTLCGQIVENWQGNPIQKESLRVFFLVLQVTHYLDAGQVKSVKPCLKQLQQCIQTISTLHDDEILPSNPADLFHWLPKEHMCVLVYLVTVMHSMQAGYLEKAQKYTDKALMQLEKLKTLTVSEQLLSTSEDCSPSSKEDTMKQNLNKACGNAMDAHEAAQMHQNFSQQLLQDHIEACSLPEHNLITWTDGPPPVQFQAQNGPTTSLASLL
ncbi:MAU2 chromatid cohesion factor like protein [Chelonia mydas]|uniref:Cohesin loading complex subunit SCC4 homolog n=1 Tax=Chelonia mydas TaxID=8469 RepID=M7B748_CHEMY|nr:MAU2 chromatid cohesion factor like protein [Chelonia mydas]